MGTRWRWIVIGILVLYAVGCAPTPQEAAPTPVPDASTAGPVIEVDTTGAPPTELTITDLTDGSGDLAEDGDVVRVSYVGRGWRSGVQVGAWDAPLFEFQLGAGEVVEGFDRGIVGMAEGGRRRIIVPSDLAYGGADLGALTEDTLVFVVELVDVVP